MTAPRANIYAVAERAGVSIATVSRVQRGVGPVSTETRERVEQAIDELGYSPDPTGRALAGQRLDAMGIVFPDLAGPYYSSVLLGAEAASVAAGSSLLILATHGRPRAEELARELSARVDGLIVMGRTVSDEAVRALGARVPLVLLARDARRRSADRSQRRIASRRAGSCAHLLESTATSASPSSAIRAPRRTPKTAGRGSWTRIDAQGVPAPPAAFAAPFHEHGGREAAGAALDQAPRPTALVCASDEIALGAYSAAQRPGPAPRDRHRRNRVGRHPARALRLTCLDHRPAADDAARRTAAELLAQRVAGAPADVADAAERRGHPRELRLPRQPPTTREVVQ